MIEGVSSVEPVSQITQYVNLILLHNISNVFFICPYFLICLIFENSFCLMNKLQELLKKLLHTLNTINQIYFQLL